MKIKILIILFLSVCTSVYAETAASEGSVKAAFIFHFLSFVEWSDNRPEYDVCIPEDESLRLSIEESLKNKILNNRKIVIANRSESCHILVSDNVPQTDTTLTIGSLKKGALFEFRTIGNKLKFAVNLENIKKFKLKISSQLLKLAILDSNS